MKNINKNKITGFLSLFIVFLLFLSSLITPDKDISISERRKLAQFPDLKISTVYSGKFMDEYRNYLSDQIFLRDNFRKLKSYSAYNFFNKSDNNGYFIKNNHISKLDYPINYNSLNRASDIFNEIYLKNLADKNTNVYFSVIPDKNFVLNNDKKFLSYDYYEFRSFFERNLKFAKQIDIYPLLEPDDYFFTDPHLKQEKTADIARHIAFSMGNEITEDFKENTAQADFYGAYYSHAAINSNADKIVYLTNKYIDNCRLYDYESRSYKDVYNLKALNSSDAYSMFLQGSKSLLKLESENARTDKKLIIFRDSFASAIAPLLSEIYSEIILADIRYISSSSLSNFIDFSNSDILFLYSSAVLNDSILLKK